jgi:hypothetical protein
VRSSIDRAGKNYKITALEGRNQKKGKKLFLGGGIFFLFGWWYFFSFGNFGKVVLT